MHLSLLLLPIGALALLRSEVKRSANIGEDLNTANETEAEERARLLAQIIPVHIDKNEEDVHFEGDYGHPSGLESRKKRQAVSYADKWPENTVYYFYDRSLPQEIINGVKVALKEIESRSCVRFVESKTAPNRIRLHYGKGCSSSIGMDGGQQDMSLGAGCGRVVGNIQHEFFHALGFMHTQSREGRDNFINVDLSGLTEFVDQSEVKLTKAYVPYEYGSFMHYTADLYSGRKIAFVPKDTRYLYTMGSKMMSFYDVVALNKHYGCTGCAACKNGGVPNVRDCRVCECPAGYGGALCDERPSGCGTMLTATSEWNSEKITVGDVNQKHVKDNFQKCNTWITAPHGKQIEVKITEMVNPNCNFGCKLNGIEIKGDEDTKLTNPRYCCDESVGTVVRSEQNPTPVISYARAWYSTFTIEYRYVSACIDNGYCDEDYCESEDHSFADKKFNCGKTCGLCGQPVPLCVDNEMCADFLESYEGSCQQLLEGIDIQGNDQLLEYYCAKSCNYCTKNTTITTTTTTLKPIVTEIQVTDNNNSGNNGTKADCGVTESYCEKAFGDVVVGQEVFYHCGKYCSQCDMYCKDSKFCDGLLKDYGNCDKLMEVFEYNNDRMDFFCGKSCATWCDDN